MTDAAPAAPPRLAFLDALRGLALLGMFVFHFTWDLGFFQFIPPEFPYSPGFMFFGHIVASTFLALTGASLVLASRDGMNWPAFRKRLGMIVAAAAAITSVTYFIFPDSFIFFGILHCIAVASILALAFLHAPLWIVIAAAAAIIALPWLYASSIFDTPALTWVGLGLREPRSNDWRAFFPWAGFALAGVALMRAGLTRGLPQALTSWRAGNRATSALTWGGRHSLLVYLVHQPIFLALVYGASLLLNPQDSHYQHACTTQCGGAGSEAGFCARACQCVATKAKSENIWRKVLSNSLSPAEHEKFVALGQQCSKDAAP